MARAISQSLRTVRDIRVPPRFVDVLLEVAAEYQQQTSEN